MLPPHVTEIRHMGASPHAPAWSPSELHAAGRCEPLRKPPPTLPAVPVDVYPIDMEDAA